MKNLDIEISNNVSSYIRNKLWDKMYYNVSCKVWAKCSDNLGHGINRQVVWFLTKEMKKNINLC